MTASLIASLRCVASAVGPLASLVTRRRRSLLRFSCVANGVCLWRRRSLRFARHTTASLIASLLLRCKRRVPVAPSVPSLRSSHDDVAHCFAFCLRRMRRRSLLRFSCVANGVCLWRRRSLRFARTCRRRSSFRSSCSHGGVAHCFASLALQTACACGAVGPFASLVT